MSSLILVRHSLPAIDPCVASHHWPLSPEGRQRCRPLARALAPYLPAAFFSSREPKAAETAALVARELGVSFAPRAGLHEHTRHTAEWLSAEGFQAAIRGLFERPAEVVWGEESADAAHARFAAAIEALLAEQPAGHVVVFTHGTVLALYAARSAGLDAHAFWRRLKLPAVVVLDRQTRAVQAVIEEVPADGD
jgi:broad specificity phosphatase PhoE